MRRMLSVLAFAIAGLFAAAPSQAATISVDLSTQTMHVSSNSGEYDWPISSGRSGFGTPNGSYGVQRMEVMHRSHEFHNSPMPHSIFFHGGYAIHGTYETGHLGAPASHGCVRISPAHAALLYSIVKEEGARISIEGATAGGSRHYAAGHSHHHHLQYASRHHHMTALGYAEMRQRHVPSVQTWMRSPVDSIGGVYDGNY